MTPAGLPHSGTHGSKPAYGSPWHFAADRALLRLLAPRHPPYALSSLTYAFRHFGSLCESFDNFFSVQFSKNVSLVFLPRHRAQGCALVPWQYILAEVC